jgi:hypothetical protein
VQRSRPFVSSAGVARDHRMWRAAVSETPEPKEPSTQSLPKRKRGRVPRDPRVVGDTSGYNSLPLLSGT